NPPKFTPRTTAQTLLNHEPRIVASDLFLHEPAATWPPPLSLHDALPISMDNGRGSNANHDAAWALYDPWAEWHVVVEDDAVLTSGFLQQAAAALAAAPGDGAVSFYLGNSRPKPTE